MSNTYKLTFTQDRVNYTTLTIPAKSLVDAYIEIQTRFPNAEITEATEKETWAKSISKYFLDKASFDELCAFTAYLDEEQREEFVKALWNEWHNKNAKANSKAV